MVAWRVPLKVFRAFTFYGAIVEFYTGYPQKAVLSVLLCGPLELSLVVLLYIWG